jgi:hypothetical protein
MRRRVTQCLVARNGNDVSWEFPGPTNLSLSRKRTYVWNLCGTDGLTPSKNRGRTEQISSYFTEVGRRSTTRRTRTFPDCLPASPLPWVHAFAKQGAALFGSPLRSESLPTPVVYRCVWGVCARRDWYSLASCFLKVPVPSAA